MELNTVKITKIRRFYNFLEKKQFFGLFIIYNVEFNDNIICVSIFIF